MQIAVFVQGYGTYDVWWSELLLWFGIAAFFVNYLLLRTIKFYYAMQRVVAFILINFGIYFSIVNVFGNDVVYLMSFGMLRSILNSLAIFHAKYFSQQGILEYKDYFYWIGTNLLATLVNIYFVFFLPVSAQLRFSIGAIYFGMQFFLLLYNLRFVQTNIKT
ncbi:MAG: hypothetical protein H6765_09775 [Candidatus Peribacteria bacterium]|nr:MAG: hypothetical protein H6765_09775 [Candidatus Peribacteria bacterium]